jgi:hypothetical protein
MENFRKLSLQCTRIVYYLLTFFTHYLCFGIFLSYHPRFYRISYVSGKFPETFRKLSENFLSQLVTYSKGPSKFTRSAARAHHYNMQWLKYMKFLSLVAHRHDWVLSAIQGLNMRSKYLGLPCSCLQKCKRHRGVTLRTLCWCEPPKCVISQGCFYKPGKSAEISDVLFFQHVASPKSAAISTSRVFFS